jgi:hypothetical protein
VEYEYGGLGIQYGLAIQETSEGDFIIGGQTFSEGAGGGDAYALRVNASNMGTPAWTKTYGQVDNEEIVGITANSDGTSILAIRDSLPNEPIDGNIDIWIVKISNSNGDKIYDKVFGGSKKDTPKSINPLGNGEYIVGGISRSFWGEANSAPQMWLLKVKDFGDRLDTLWSRNFGTTIVEHDHCHMAKASNDGGLLVVGHSRTHVMRIWFLKLNSEGQLIVGAEENTPLVENILLYPNPVTSGVLNIKHSFKAAYTIKATDILGKTIYSHSGNDSGSNEIEVDMRGNLPGIYFISIESGEAKLTKKILMQ